jgi:hypothetical protein
MCATRQARLAASMCLHAACSPALAQLSSTANLLTQGHLGLSTLSFACYPAALQIIGFAFVYLQPLNRGWSTWAYSKLTLALIFSQGLKVHTAHGLPAAFNLAAIKQWLMRVLSTSDAQYFLLALAAAGNKPVTGVLPPFLVLAAYQLGSFLAAFAGNHYLWQRHGIHIYRQMQAKQQFALGFNAQSEIGLGFLLLVGLPFPGRAPMFAFMAWQFLRMRYWSSDAAVYHRQVRSWIASCRMLWVYLMLWQVDRPGCSAQGNDGGCETWAWGGVSKHARGRPPRPVASLLCYQVYSLTSIAGACALPVPSVRQVRGCALVS